MAKPGTVELELKTEDILKQMDLVKSVADAVIRKGFSISDCGNGLIALGEAFKSLDKDKARGAEESDSGGSKTDRDTRTVDRPQDRYGNG